jgi:hypothetical protein
VKIETSLLTEPWPHAMKGTLALLICHMNLRWASDGLTPEQACTVVLDRGSLFQITGKSRIDYALLALQQLAVNINLTVRQRGDFIEIFWPKFAETQSLGRRSAPLTGQQEEEEEEEEEEVLQEQAPPGPSGLSPPTQETLELELETPTELPITCEIIPLAPPPTTAPMLAPRKIAENLANLLAKKSGTYEEHVEWIDQNIDLMIAELEAEGVENPRRNWGALKTRMFRWWSHEDRQKNGKPSPPRVESFEDNRVRKLAEFAKGDDA